MDGDLGDDRGGAERARGGDGLSDDPQLEDLPLGTGEDALEAEELVGHGGSGGPGDPSPSGSSNSALFIGALLLFGVLGGVGACFWARKEVPPVTPDQAATATQESTTTSPSSPPPAEVAPEPKLDLPPLNSSDPEVRTWVSQISTHPKVQEWLGRRDLVRRAVASVDNLARGESPSAHLEFLRPTPRFEASEDAFGESRTSAKSFDRYDLLTEVFTSLDTGATVRLYYNLEPLLEDAYSELGDPRATFKETLGRAIDRLLAVEVPDQAPKLISKVSSYAYYDPELEALPQAEKHLLRLGPENARKVQAKLRFFKSALDLPESN